MRIFRKRVSFIIAASILLISMLWVIFVLSPAISRNNFLNTHIRKMETDFLGMKQLENTWDAFQKTKLEAEKAIHDRGKNFTILSYLEQIARELGIDHNIQSIKPVSFGEVSGSVRPEGIEMKLTGIGIEQLTNFLLKIEYSGKLINIGRIRIVRTSAGNLRSLEVTLQVNTYNIKV